MAAQQIRRGALIVVAVCAGMSALVAVQYQTTFQGSIDAAGLRALAENPAIRILFGRRWHSTTQWDFTVWRTGLPVLVLSSVWILLAATRITRGEEDAGRSDLLLAGRLRVVDVVQRAMGAVVVAAVLPHCGGRRRSVGRRGHRHHRRGGLRRCDSGPDRSPSRPQAYSRRR